ncbi:hypothetical protein SEA_TARYNEARAL_74 [Mycobacterium phage Tarynearal]|nr:hypothetical protein SEA_TARYNEARAL_74 [Mycobacterium phage Tarynearal]
MDTSSTERTDRVVINLVVELDLEEYARGFGLVGARSARDDLKKIVLYTVQNELQRMGLQRCTIYRR